MDPSLGPSRDPPPDLVWTAFPAASIQRHRQERAARHEDLVKRICPPRPSDQQSTRGVAAHHRTVAAQHEACNILARRPTTDWPHAAGSGIHSARQILQPSSIRWVTRHTPLVSPQSPPSHASTRASHPPFVRLFTKGLRGFRHARWGSAPLQYTGTAFGATPGPRVGTRMHWPDGMSDY